MLTKSRLDRLGEALKRGDLSISNLTALATFRNLFISSTNTVADKIASYPKPFKIDITRRPAKSTVSIVAKLKRESSRLTQIQDIGGVRVVVSKVSVQDKVVALVQRLYPGARVIDRRANPQFGYRAVHVIVSENGRLVEVQVRTTMQNGWAQFSEKYADLYDPLIKYGKGPKPIMEQLRFLTEYCTEVEAREVELDSYKRAEISGLHRRKRSKKMTPDERRRLDEYQSLLREKRAAKTRMLQYFKGAI